MRKKVDDNKNTILFRHFVLWIFLNFQLTAYECRYKHQLPPWAHRYQAKEGGKENVQNYQKLDGEISFQELITFYSRDRNFSGQEIESI